MQQYTLAQKTNIYFIHGQGSDPRLFSKLKLNTNFDTVCLWLPLPEKGESMFSFAQKLIPKIDTTAPFILVGVSLGGMVASELNEMIHPKQTIIISSAKNSNELPKRYKFMRALPIYKLFPAGFIKLSSFVMQPLIEPDRKKEKALFKSMLRNKNKLFLKRTIPMIINWNKQVNSGKIIIHLHGTKDHTLPIRNIQSPIVVRKGSHMMVLTQPELISSILNEILNKNAE
jgi:pimeloyl-ACP methyl ester carboxylesterase